MISEAPGPSWSYHICSGGDCRSRGFWATVGVVYGSVSGRLWWLGLWPPISCCIAVSGSRNSLMGHLIRRKWRVVMGNKELTDVGIVRRLITWWAIPARWVHTKLIGVYSWLALLFRNYVDLIRTLFCRANRKLCREVGGTGWVM